MIAYLEGRLLNRTESACVVLTAGGVGYEVHLTAHGVSRLPETGDEVQFHTSTIVREDAMELYGFSNSDERDTFNVLLSISKLGPKTALATLSVFSPDDLRQLVAGDDPDMLTQVPGIGKKSAQHIFLELKYKLKSDIPAGLPGASQAAVSAYRDALAGLVNLGYSEAEARPALEQVFDDEPDMDVAGALRLALKAMAKSR